MKMLGPWQQEAAARALSGTDQDVLDYLRTRWKEADQHDIRQRVVNLSTQSPTEAVRTAATAALTGSPEQIEAFYTTGQYQAGSTDRRIEVAHLATTGGTYLSEAAEAALKTGTPKALGRVARSAASLPASDETAVLIVVVAAVTEHDVGAAPRPAAFAPHGRHCLEQRNELDDVVAVAAGQGDSERDAGGISDQVMLGARPAPVEKASSRLGAPF